LLTLILSIASQGYAAITQYYDVTSFGSATTGYTVFTEDFEYPVAVTGDQNSVGVDYMSFSGFDVSSGLLSLKVMDDPFIPGRIPQDTGNHNTTAGGYNFLSADTNQINVGDYMLMSFSQPIYAFGVYLIDIESGGMVTAGGSSFSVSSTPNGGDTFFGLVSDTPFTTVNLNLGGSDSNWSVDDVHFASTPVVPEPVSTVLFLAGGSVLAGRRFMRRRK